MFSICFKIAGNYFDAEDLAQDTFLSVYKNLDSFDDRNEKAWIARIATNKSIDFVRAKGRGQIPTEDEFFLSVEDHRDNPETAYLEKSEKEYIAKLCNSLKRPYDEIAREYFYKEKTVGQIAKELDRNEKTVQTQVYRAKVMLSKLYGKE